jgi:hypothetical protein
MNFYAASSPAQGVAFLDFLRQRAARPGVSQTEITNMSRRLWAHLNEVGHLIDEYADRGRSEPPTVPEVAERWQLPERSAYGLHAELRALFDAEPDEVWRELWRGIELQAPRGELMAIGSVRVLAKEPNASD